jgi:ribonucleoside-diphosphate reductase alpha chain
MCCLDLDHPDVEQFINWKVREELKVAAMAEGIKVLPKDQQEQAKKMGLKLDYDFNGEAYYTVSGQNSNNSIRIPNKFFKAVEEDGDWNLVYRTSGKIAKTVKARDLWEQIAFAAWRCADPGVQYDDTINQWHTCPRSGRINASNPCVTGDTRVLTPGGIWRRIDQMIHLPARLVTNLHAQEIHTTEGAFPTGTQDVFQLKTAGGYKLTLTANHKIHTRSRGWVEAKHLTPADEIRLPSKPAAVHEIGEPQDPRLFQLLGLFLSTANAATDAVRLDAALRDANLIDTFAQYAHDNWGAGLYNDDYTTASMIDDDYESTGSQSATSSTTLTNRRLLSRLRAFVRSDNGARRLGDEAFTAGLAAQRHFLRGLFTADAQIRNNSLELHGHPDLLEDVQLILLGFGIKSSIYSSDSAFSLLPSAFNKTLSGDSPERRISHPGDAATPGHDGGAVDPAARIADIQRHGLRIDSGSLRSFGKHVGLLPGRKLEQLAHLISMAIATPEDAGNYDRVASLTPTGRQQVFDLTEPVTSSFVANGITVHNCSEYMFLDDTACNLASLNVLTFFDAETRRFDIEAYKHATRVWTIVLEVSVLMASFPSEAIARLSYKFRTLGLGYANLGAMLMQAGIPYDSEKGRAICAALTAILTGESYATSADMAAELGAFPGYDENRDDMLRVIRNHRRAAHGVGLPPSPGTPGEGRGEGRASIRNPQSAIGNYENLDIPPVPIDASQFSSADPLASDALLAAARETWDRALTLGERHGYRNAQTTVIAPTGTIGLLMDCDTTGVEPDFALVKFKKLAGGGYFKIANQSLRPALVNLGYAPEQINDILKYVLGTLTLHDAPHVNTNSLLAAGLTPDELTRIEDSLPGMFELGFAFSPYTMGAAALQRLGIPEAEWQAPGFNLLQRLGFTRRQIALASDVICGRGTVEGAPHLRPEHLPVFDCANKCGKTGTRFIPVEGHIRMMAAAQPFISGAISKTINLPNEATLEEIKSSYHLSWELGLKANALYRDGSKLSQPLNVKSDEDLNKHDEEDEDAIEEAKEEVANQVAQVASSLNPEPRTLNPLTSDNLSPAPHHTHIIEKIVERIVERPLRRRLPDTRHAKTHKFDVAGHEGYITTGLYEDGSPGEVFITMAKEGSTIGGLMDTIATLVSVALQYGVPVESLVRKFEHVRFEPSGMTRNPEIPIAKSLVDYIFRWLAMEFIEGYRAANAPKRPEKKKPAETPAPAPAKREGEAPSEPSSSSPEPFPRPHKKEGNGHGPRIEPDTAHPFAYGDEPRQAGAERSAAPDTGVNLRLQIVVDPLSQQGTEMQADAPACDVCGSITVRSGTCYKCMNCGNSMGCS